MTGPWREPDERTTDYPGLEVWDARVSGSITLADSRLPLWAFTWIAVTDDWDTQVEAGWSPGERYGWTADNHGAFLTDLLEQRGEFARLLCILADVERRAREQDSDRVWWDRKKQRARVMTQLQRCLDVLT